MRHASLFLFYKKKTPQIAGLYQVGIFYVRKSSGHWINRQRPEPDPHNEQQNRIRLQKRSNTLF